jgi:DNA-binding protein HU-beta
MTKQAVIDDMAENGRMTKADAGRALDQVAESLTRVLERGGPGTRVIMPGLGTFNRVMSTRTSARNPQTGETIAMTPRPVTKFKPPKGG